jgi:hypothetical protein
MSIIRKMRKQKAVWWQRNEVPDHFGKFSFHIPLVIDCRWEDAKMEFVDRDGQKSFSDAVVYVDRVMAEGDRVFLGGVSSIPVGFAIVAQSGELIVNAAGNPLVYHPESSDPFFAFYTDEDLAGMADPLSVKSFEVKRFDILPNLKDTEMLFTAHLRYGHR